MKLKKYLYQITNKLTFAQDSLFTVSVKEQKKFIMGLKEPRDLIERSYNQYLCQRWLKRGYINLFTDLLSIPLIVYFLLKNQINSLFQSIIEAFASELRTILFRESWRENMRTSCMWTEQRNV